MFSVKSLNSVTQKLITVKGFEPACVKEQHTTTASARQMRETGYLNSAKFTLQ